jgi:hypothetical protein
MTYAQFLTSRIQTYLNQVANGQIVDPNLPFIELDWSQDHTAYFSTLVKHKVITAKDVSRETKAAQCAEELRVGLGEVPDSARDYARIYSKKIGVQVSYKGAITIRLSLTTPAALDLPLRNTVFPSAVKPSMTRSKSIT